MCETSWVDDNEVTVATGFLDAVDDGAFVVRLEGVECDVEGLYLGFGGCFYVCESCAALLFLSR